MDQLSTNLPDQYIYFSIWCQLLDRPQQLLVIVLIPITSFVAQSELISSEAFPHVTRPHIRHVSVDMSSTISSSSSSGGVETKRHPQLKTSLQPPLQVIYTCRSETWITVNDMKDLSILFIQLVYKNVDRISPTRAQIF